VSPELETCPWACTAGLLQNLPGLPWSLKAEGRRHPSSGAREAVERAPTRGGLAR
jgi:hypothetical protein